MLPHTISLKGGAACITRRKKIKKSIGLYDGGEKSTLNEAKFDCQ